MSGTTPATSTVGLPVTAKLPSGGVKRQQLPHAARRVVHRRQVQVVAREQQQVRLMAVHQGQQRGLAP